MSFREDIKEFLSFTKGERKGIFVLLIILLLVIFANIFSDVFIKNQKFDFSEFENDIKEFEREILSAKVSSLNTQNSLNLFKFNPNYTSDTKFAELGLTIKQIRTIRNYLAKGGKFNCRSDFKKIYGISDEQYIIFEPYIDLPVIDIYDNSDFELKKIVAVSDSELFYFDPNIISDIEWMRLGFSEKQVSVIRKYVINGGRFYKKEDLKKIYIINDKKYKELEPYIQIKKDNSLFMSIKEKKKDDDIVVRIDINKFTKEDFQELGGTWKYLGDRIVKYRNLLGAYAKKEQLLEVYGLKKEFYNSVSHLIDIDKAYIKKVNINFAEFSELYKHPYLTETDVKNIINYRNNEGSYKKLVHLYEYKIITKETFLRIQPYIKIK